MIQRAFSYLSRGDFGPTLVRAFAGSAGIRIAGMALGFLVGVQLARGLGAAGYGVYGLAMSIVSLVMIPVEFGLPQLVTREVASGHARQDLAHVRGVFAWANRVILRLSLAIFVIGLAGWLLFGDRLNEDLRSALLAGAFLIPSIALANLRGAALRGMQQIVRGQIPEVVLRPAIFSVLLFGISVVLPSGLTPSAAMAMHAVAVALTLVFAAYMLRAVFPTGRLEVPSRSTTQTWLHSTIPMALTEAMRVLQGNFSVLLLGALATTVAVGIFRVASSMSLLLNMPVALIHVVSGPIISRFHASNDTNRLQKLLSWTALSMVVGSVCMTIPFVFFGAEILGLLFGSEYSPSNGSLLILSAGSIVGSAFGPGATLLNMTGHEKRVTRSLGLSLLLLATLSLPLIFYFGAIGAALANSISFVFWSVVLWNDGRKFLGVDASLTYAIKYHRHFFGI
jgi:O-antigen/teichoic acid export membrane protein